MLNFTAECDYVLETKNINRLILGGWTGRDADAVETHIVELEELGVARPKSVPTFFRMSRDRITTGKVIEVSGPDTSGEVEFVIVNSPKNGLLLGVGSDHTDRKLETVSVCQSKQICEKVIAPVFWNFEEVHGHWDSLILRSFIYEGGKRITYQEGSVDSMLHVDTLLADYKVYSGSSFGMSDVIMGGTISAIGGIRSSSRFEFEIEDPILGRKISHHYKITTLPIPI